MPAFIPWWGPGANYSQMITGDFIPSRENLAYRRRRDLRQFLIGTNE